MGHTLDPSTGKPTFNNTPSTVSDLQAAADYTEQVSVLWVDTVADLENILYPREGEVRRVRADGSYHGFDGTGWEPINGGGGSGLSLIKPTSASGGTISADGSVSFSGAASAALDGVFTSEYDWYRVVASVTASTSASLLMGLRAGGATNVTTNYNRQIQFASGSSATGAASPGDTKWELAVASRTSFQVELDVFNPAVVGPTNATNKASSSNAGASLVASTGAFSQTQSSVFDGLALSATAGTITGTVAVYGYRA